LKSEIESIKVEVNPHKARTETISKEIDSLSSDIASTKISLKAADAHCDTMASVVKVFSPAGVRARILDEVTPFLNKQTASYLSVLSDGNIVATWSTLTEGAKKGEFKEKFSIDVSNSTGGKSFKLISGGEKRKVRIATCLALQDLVSTRASKPIELFIGDEIDEALDAAGLERLMSILEEKARSKGSVMVISHNELSDYISNVITVEKDKSGRTIVTEVSA
jgi:DNA repair exonuclease SbcCD ATPase subunit